MKGQAVLTETLLRSRGGGGGGGDLEGQHQSGGVLGAGGENHILADRIAAGNQYYQQTRGSSSSDLEPFEMIEEEPEGE